MEETFANILEKISFEKKDLFEKLLLKSIHTCKDSSKSTYAIHDNVIFKLDAFFKGFLDFQNAYGRDKRYIAGVEALMVIGEELGIDMDRDECFILYHIRDLGKFRMRESKLHDELKILWKQPPYRDFALVDQDFSYALKSLMKKSFIEYRRGNLHLNPSVLIRYKTR